MTKAITVEEVALAWKAYEETVKSAQKEYDSTIGPARNKYYALKKKLQKGMTRQLNLLEKRIIK